jgi:hypothetical protein
MFTTIGQMSQVGPENTKVDRPGDTSNTRGAFAETSPAMATECL